MGYFFYIDAAYCYRCWTFCVLCVCLCHICVCVCVCVLDTAADCTETTKPIVIHWLVLTRRTLYSMGLHIGTT